MEQFVVSARKYRPATFNSVVGQLSITTTLKNAIKNNHLAHAFLFCGPRGVGKTTCARILAKTINCTNLTADTEGCNECDSCTQFNNGQSLNIFELDGASNNTVDGMRNLVEQVRYPPQSGKYKIYIIDEVHMLSTGAFNAFLKTLEEPPSYAIFILATTEKHKIIPTILSRCQIFDFNRITIDDISAHLAWIAGNEKVEAEPEALHTIAQKADGALRDALSIFDQIVSYAGNKVTYKHVIDNLNILDYDYYFRMTDFILQQDYSSCLLLLDEIVNEGFDLHHFVTGIASHFRDLLIARDPKTVKLLEVGERTRERYLAQSAQFQSSQLLQFLHIINRCDVEFKSAQVPRLHTEIALLKICTPNDQGVGVNSAEPADKKKVVAQPTPPEIPANKPESVSVPVTSEAETSPVSQPQTSAIKSNTAPAKKAETVEPQIPKISSRSGRSATISIAAQLSDSAKTDEVTQAEEPALTETRPFTTEQAQAALTSYAEKLIAGGRKQLALSITFHPAVVKENHVIEITVENAIQSGELQENLHDLLSYLKQQLMNGAIRINIMVNETEGIGNAAYTPAEKYQQMVQKNPELNKLKQQFDLELDY
jgi:DNA polymerase III subunit gamma/tau